MSQIPRMLIQGLHDWKQITRAELQKAYSCGSQHGQNQRPPLTSSSNTDSYQHQPAGFGQPPASYASSSSHVIQWCES